MQVSRYVNHNHSDTFFFWTSSGYSIIEASSVSTLIWVNWSTTFQESKRRVFLNVIHHCQYTKLNHNHVQKHNIIIQQTVWHSLTFVCFLLKNHSLDYIDYTYKLVIVINCKEWGKKWLWPVAKVLLQYFHKGRVISKLKINILCQKCKTCVTPPDCDIIHFLITYNMNSMNMMLFNTKNIQIYPN
jgi:hypothetical protein